MEKVGYSFDAWLDNETADLEVTEYYQAGVEYTMPAHDVTFVAQWKPNEYKLSYEIGEDANYPVPSSIDCYYGDTVKLATLFDDVYVGKIFGGWSDGTAVYPMGADYTMPAKDTTLTAVWNDPLTKQDIIGKWTTADGDTLEILDNMFGSEYIDCVAIMDGLGLVNVILDESMVESLDYTKTWVIYGTPSMLMLTEFVMNTEGEDSIEILGSKVYTNKTEIVDVEMSEFAGKWVRTGANQPWLIGENEARYGLNLNNATATVVGAHIVLTYNAAERTYVYILDKGADSLIGYYIAPEAEPIEVEFDKGEFVTLKVEGAYNQIIMSAGAKPDADKINAAKPQAPNGQEFDKWVIAGTDTEFDVNAVINEDTEIEATFKDINTSAEKTYVGSWKKGLNTYTQIVIDTESLAYSYSGSKSGDGTAQAVAGNDKAYKITINGENFWILISDDGSTLQIFDYQTMDDEDLVATFTLQE